jgi:hypothetical protein
MTFLLHVKTSFESHESSYWLLKILPDTAPFPNLVGEKIFITEAYIKKKYKSLYKKNQVDWWGTTSSFLSSKVTILEDRENSKNHKKQKNIG